MAIISCYIYTMFAIIIHNLLCKIVIHRHFKLNNHFNFRVHKWSRALEVLGESSKDAERAAREVRRRVRSVLGDEAACGPHFAHHARGFRFSPHPQFTMES